MKSRHYFIAIEENIITYYYALHFMHSNRKLRPLKMRVWELAWSCSYWQIDVTCPSTTTIPRSQLQCIDITSIDMSPGSFFVAAIRFKTVVRHGRTRSDARHAFGCCDTYFTGARSKHTFSSFQILSVKWRSEFFHFKSFNSVFMMFCECDSNSYGIEVTRTHPDSVRIS